MTRALTRLLLACACVWTLGGCSTLTALSEASRPLEIFELSPPAAGISARRIGAEIVVEEPIATGSIATERIMVRPAPFQTQYLPGVRWSDTAPVMMQTLMVRTLSQSGAFGSVGRRPVGLVADYVLLTELTDFQAERQAGDRDTLVRVRLNARLLREADARVFAQTVFSRTAVTTGTAPETVVAAYNAATEALLRDLTNWVVSRTR